MAAYPEVAEESLEQFALVHVVVLPEHVHQQRLAEAAGAYEEEVVVGLFDERDEAGLVYIIIVAEPYVLPVLHAVGQPAWFLLLCGRFVHRFAKFSANIRIIMRNGKEKASNFWPFR